MSEELFLYFMQSGHTISLTEFFQSKDEIIAGRQNRYLSRYLDKQKIMHVSRVHFKLSQKDSRLFIEDLESANGTEVDYKELSPKTPVELQVGCIIRLAKKDNFLIRLIDEEELNKLKTIIDEPSEQASPHEEEYGLEFDEALDVFIVDGQAIHLSQTLHALLDYLYKNAERGCSYYQINSAVWFGHAKRNTITGAVANLRKKLNEISLGAGERYIKNDHGYGYRLTRK